VGSQSLILAKRISHLRFVVQDRESVVGDAVEVCTLNPPIPVKHVADDMGDSSGRRTCPTPLDPAA